MAAFTGTATMLTERAARYVLILIGAIVFGTPIALAEPSAAAGSESSDADEGLLSLTVSVRMPDGSPAAGTVVESHSDPLTPAVTSLTDAAGTATLRDTFDNGAQIYARTADGAHQAVLMAPAANVRSMTATPVEVTLAPAVPHDVSVTAQGQTVEGAVVIASGDGFRASGRSNADGQCRLLLPAGQRVETIGAWHPELGVDGLRDWQHGINQPTTELSLLEPSPYTIRAVDPQNRPVPGIEVAVSVATETRSGFFARQIPESHVVTNADGEAVVNWVPRELGQSLYASIVGDDWKVDELNRERAEERITTLEVRRKRMVEGRVTFAGGAPVAGLLVTGFGFGPENNGDGAYARTRSDGTFRMPVASLHGYVLGVSDREWASELWPGIILGSDTDEPQPIEFEAYPATPVTVQVTRGDDQQPVSNAWVHFSRNTHVPLARDGGTGYSGVRGWLLTDSNGLASTGIGRGETEFRLTAGDWGEEQSIEVDSSEPVSVSFHRPWIGQRNVVARMTLDGQPYEPSANLVAKAWSDRLPQVSAVHEPTIRDDGSIEVIFDHENLALLAIDRDRQLSGFASLGPADTAAELTMQPMASYSGTLFDENGDPLADRTLQLMTTLSWLDVVEPQRTDEAGHFQFAGVAVQAPLRLNVKNDEGLPQYFLFDGDRIFEPGEVREDDNVRPRRLDDSADRPAPPLADRVANSCENARVVGMRGLVLLKGDDSENVDALVDRVTNTNGTKPVLAYLPVTVTAAQVESEAETLDANGWPKPPEGQIALIALSATQETIAVETVSATDVNVGVAVASAFLDRHKPQFADAREKLADARQQARATSRRVWIISSGPRCGPCFRLARWMEEHHALLEKDYLIVKVMGGLEEHAIEIGDEIGGAEHGIPWSVIAEPDGTILTTSEGPLGNIGMPSSIEGVRHFRHMLESTAQSLTAAEIDALIDSLTVTD